MPNQTSKEIKRRKYLGPKVQQEEGDHPRQKKTDVVKAQQLLLQLLVLGVWMKMCCQLPRDKKTNMIDPLPALCDGCCYGQSADMPFPIEKVD